MKRKLYFFIASLLILTILAGCSSSKSSPNIDAQTTVIKAYMEALRDQDKDKLLSVMEPNKAAYNIQNPEELDAIIEEQKKLGTMKSCDVLPKTAYVDEINGQTIVEAQATYPDKTFNLQFDVRRIGEQWYVYGVSVVNIAEKMTQ